MDDISTAFDDPPESHNEYEKELLLRVKESGWQSTHVFADTDGDPSFTYSTGFWQALGRPEVIVFDFPARLAHDVIGQTFRLLSDGADIQTEKPVTNILSGESVYFFAVDEEAKSEYLLSSKWFYKGNQFPAIQMVWPDPSGSFPWQPNFERKLIGLQPDISKISWSNML